MDNITNANGMGTRVALRGYERLLTMAENGSMQIVTTMVVRSASDEALRAFVDRLPEALVRTFNTHPRMRAKQLRDEFAMAQIQPPITLETLRSDKLFEVRDALDDGSWEKYAEAQSNIPIDRFTQLPYYVRVWQYPTSREPLVRVMVFADHYMSDGISSLAVLHDLVRFASEEPSDASGCYTELPLRPSLYDMWMGPHKVTHPLRRWFVRKFGQRIFKHELKHFTPAIPLRADQADFALPPTINSSSARFGQGTVENMSMVLSRCKKERVTFFGVLAASVVTAFAIAHAANANGSTTMKPRDPFTLGVEVDFNMRKRVRNPVEEVQVGAYLATNALETLAKKGVRLDKVNFWDLARNLKSELDHTLASFLMPLPLLFLDLNFHSQVSSELVANLAIPHSISSDVNISNIGKYPYPTTHRIMRIGEAQELRDEMLTIDSVHVYNSSPNIGSAAIVYVTSTDKFNYSMMHKFDDKHAQTIFDALVACVESVGSIESHATMAEVANQVRAITTERSA
ncbi:hypothetical protein FI667_g5850, partial [Globisporangium splendens]